MLETQDVETTGADDNDNEHSIFRMEGGVNLQAVRAAVAAGIDLRTLNVVPRDA